MRSDWCAYLGAEPWEPTTDDVRVWEEVGGVRVEKKRGVWETVVAHEVGYALQRFLRINPVGSAYLGMEYEWAAVGCRRKTDVSFVSLQTWPRSKPFPRVDWWPVVPDLVVEIAGTYDLAHSTLTKVQECFVAGVKQVWLVFPHLQQVYVYTSPVAVRVLTRADTLTADDVLPGFAVPVADLFPPAEPPPATPTT